MFNYQTQSAIVWNPETMTISGQIPLDASDVTDFALFQIADTVIVRGTSVLVPVFWHDGDYVRFNSFGRIYEIDIATDKVIATRDFTECVGLVSASLDEDGTIYVSSDSYMSFTRRVLGSPNGSQSCAVEIPPGGTVAEATITNLQELAGGRPAGSVIVSGDTTYLRVRENADAWTPETYQEGIEAGEMRWWTWNPESGSASPAEEGLSAAGGSFYFKPDDRVRGGN